MSNTNSVVATFTSHDQAENAIRELQKDGFDMKKLSIVGKDYQTEEQVVGYYNTGELTSVVLGTPAVTPVSGYCAMLTEPPGHQLPAR